MMGAASLIEVATERATAAVAETAAKPTNDMNPLAVAQAAPELQANIGHAIAPIIANLTNTEAHFWQKRTFWAALYSGLGSLLALADPTLVALRYISEHMGQKLTVGVVVLGAMAGYASIRAGRASTPLGTPNKPLPYPLNRG